MKKTICAALAVLLLLLSLYGCSSKSDHAVNGELSSSGGGIFDKGEGWAEAEDMGMSEPSAAPGDYVPTESGGSGVEGVEERKRIVYIDVVMETLEYEKTISQLKTMLSEVGGYVDSSEEHNSPAYGSGARSARFKLRIPHTDANGFAESLHAIGHVLSQSEHGDDVTEQYFDIETRLSSLEMQRDKYMELLDKAEDVSYIIELTRALSDVIYQIESYTTTLRRLDSLVTYSTVTVDVNEVVTETKTPDEVTFGSRVADAFTGSIDAFVAAIQWVAIAFVAASPYLLILAVIAVIIVVIMAVRRKRRR